MYLSMHIDFALHMDALKLFEPAIHFHLFWWPGERLEVWKGGQRRTIAARTGLIWSLDIVMGLKGFCSCTSVLNSRRTLMVETFLLIGAMIALHEPIVLWMAWRADMHFNAQAQTKA